MIYLASPYTGSPSDMEDRYQEARRALAFLLNRREWTYSPIVHCHDLAKAHNFPHDALFWRDYDFHMLALARAFFILALPGWDESAGVKAEFIHAAQLRKPCALIWPHLDTYLRDYIPWRWSAAILVDSKRRGEL